MKYYLGPWVQELLPEAVWKAPAGTVGLVDMRSLPGHTSGTYGFFATSDDVTLGADYRLFGQGYITEVYPAESDRAVFASMLGIPTVDGATLMDWLWSALTVYADPAGETAVLPLMATTKPELVVHLGGHSIVRSRPFRLDMPEAANVIASLQHEYRKLREAARNGQLKDEFHHRRVLDYWCDKFKVSDGGIFIPADLPKEKRLKHETTYTDDFNRADSTSLGAAWARLASGPDVLGIEANSARIPAATGALASALSITLARYESDLSSADHYAEVAYVADTYSGGGATGETTGAGGMVRKDSTTTQTFYHGRLLRSTSVTNVIQTYKFVGGTATQLGADRAITFVSGTTVRVEANGSTIKSYYGGTEVESVTDTAIAGNIRAGFRVFAGTSEAWRGDDFLSADLAVGGGITLPMLERFRARGLLRGMHH